MRGRVKPFHATTAAIHELKTSKNLKPRRHCDREPKAWREAIHCCVLLDVASFYGLLRRLRLLAKTAFGGFQLQFYQRPEIIALPMLTGDAAYYDWARRATERRGS